MSHYSRVKTAFHNREALVACLTSLGFVVETNAVIRGTHGEHAVDIAAMKKRGNGIGFVRGTDGTYDMVADWWGVAGANEQEIVQELRTQAETIQKEYARKMVLEQASRDGFELVSETNEQDGSIRIVVRRWE